MKLEPRTDVKQRFDGVHTRQSYTRRSTGTVGNIHWASTRHAENAVDSALRVAQQSQRNHMGRTSPCTVKKKPVKNARVTWHPGWLGQFVEDLPRFRSALELRATRPETVSNRGSPINLGTSDFKRWKHLT